MEKSGAIQDRSCLAEPSAYPLRVPSSSKTSEFCVGCFSMSLAVSSSMVAREGERRPVTHPIADCEEESARGEPTEGMRGFIVKFDN